LLLSGLVAAIEFMVDNKKLYFTPTVAPLLPVKFFHGRHFNTQLVTKIWKILVIYPLFQKIISNSGRIYKIFILANKIKYTFYQMVNCFRSGTI